MFTTYKTCIVISKFLQYNSLGLGGLKSEYTTLGLMVRVKPEVDALVRYVADMVGYQPYVVRNVAILLGLQLLACNSKMPKNDDEFLELYNRTRLIVNRLMEGFGGG